MHSNRFSHRKYYKIYRTEGKTITDGLFLSPDFLDLKKRQQEKRNHG